MTRFSLLFLTNLSDICDWIISRSVISYADICLLRHKWTFSTENDCFVDFRAALYNKVDILEFLVKRVSVKASIA